MEFRPSLYLAVDQDGKTVDFGLSANRDVKAATAFSRKVVETQGRAPVAYFRASRRRDGAVNAIGQFDARQGMLAVSGVSRQEQVSK